MERERERGRNIGREGKREIERESMYLCVCVLRAEERTINQVSCKVVKRIERYGKKRRKKHRKKERYIER